MKRNVTLKFVLVVVSIITAAIISLTLSFVGAHYIKKASDMAYTNFQTSMDYGYELEIKSQVQTVLSTIQREYDRFLSGEISEDEAKYNAKETVRAMRYRDDSTGYFWIDDENYILVMHPILVQNEGKNRFDLTDSDGVKIIQVIYQACHSADGGGFNKFKFTKSDGVTVAPKLAYSGIFKPWGWMISTGNYYDDIEAQIGDKKTEIQNMDTKMVSSLLVITLIGLIVVALAFYFIVMFVAVRPLMKVDKSVHEIASGNADLTKRIKPPAIKELHSIAEGFNAFAAKLQEIVIDIKKSNAALTEAGNTLENTSQETAASVTEILANINSSSSQIDKESHSVTETAAAIQGISNDIEKLEKMIENQSSGITQASAAVEQMMGNISSVNQSVEKMADSFETLASNINSGVEQQNSVNTKVEQIKTESEMLHDANAVIASIAEQTNLLAMNAAIEAAHAGEAGKGFSVVADEIRKLSETSSEQSKAIGNQLTKITESISTCVSLSENSMASFSAVTKELSDTDQLVNQIKNAMEEQTLGSSQINDALHSMNDSTVEVRTASSSMTEKSTKILSDIEIIENAMSVIKGSMDEMTAGTRTINESTSSLSEISSRMKQNIDEIGEQINQFSV